MANTKRFNMRGTIPFNYYEDDAMAKMFAFITSPSAGLKVTWKFAGWIPNEHPGGQTHMYQFHITGEEALSWKWVDCFTEKVDELGGQILTNEIEDLEM